MASSRSCSSSDSVASELKLLATAVDGTTLTLGITRCAWLSVKSLSRLSTMVSAHSCARCPPTLCWDCGTMTGLRLDSCDDVPMFGRTNGSASDETSIWVSWNAWRLPWRVTTGPGHHSATQDPTLVNDPRNETNLWVHVVTMLLTEDGWTVVISDKCVTPSAILLASKTVGTRLDGPPTTTSRRWGRVWHQRDGNM